MAHQLERTVIIAVAGPAGLRHPLCLGEYSHGLSLTRCEGALMRAPVASVHRDEPHGLGVVQDEFSFSAVREYQLISLRCGQYKTSEIQYNPYEL